MNVICLIAQREYMDIVKTKGFWISLLIFPIIFASIFFLQDILSNATQTRYYIFIDQSGQYDQAVETAIERNHQQLVLRNFVSYLLKNRKEIDLELTTVEGSSAADQLIDGADADEVAALEQWLENGGLDFAITMASPYLKENIDPFEQPSRQFIAATIPDEVDTSASPAEIAQALRPYLRGDKEILVDSEPNDLFALILIPEDVNENISRPGEMQQATEGPTEIQYWARNFTDTSLLDAISDSVNSEIQNREYIILGVDNQIVRDVQGIRMPVNLLDPTAEEGEEEVGMGDAFRALAPMGFAYLMFFSLAQGAQYLLGSTIEEKSNRVIEVLLASVTAGELMMGKLLGIGLFSLTTIAAGFLALFLFISFYQSSQTELIGQILEVIFGSELMPWFVFYTFAGYALYAGIFLAIGSLCNTIKEAQALIMPIIMIEAIPLIMIPFVINDPHNTIVRAMSWFPLLTPYLMMIRATANPPMIDVVGTTLLLLLSIIFVLWLSGKIFRMGVLRTGQPPKLLEFIRIMRQGN